MVDHRCAGSLRAWSSKVAVLLCYKKMAGKEGGNVPPPLTHPTPPCHRGVGEMLDPLRIPQESSENLCWKNPSGGGGVDVATLSASIQGP